MHKRTAVADIELDDATGFIQKINTVCVGASAGRRTCAQKYCGSRSAQRVVDGSFYPRKPFRYPWKHSKRWISPAPKCFLSAVTD